jgi:prepilin-type processing-associated H-X9-DG protein
VFFGDYNNITAVDGHVRPIWTREVDGVLSVWTALLDLE